MANRILIALLAVTLLLSSCSNRIPYDKSYDGSGVTVLKASMEQVLMPDAEEQIWQEGSEIGIFCGESRNVKWGMRQIDKDKKTATFFGPRIEGGEGIAYLPYSKSVSASSDGRIPFEINAVEHWKADFKPTAWQYFSSRAKIAVSAIGNDSELMFRYPLAVLEINTDIEKTLFIKAVTIKADVPICGQMSVAADASLSFSPVSEHVAKIIFDSPVETSSEFKAFFIVPPMENESLELSLETEDGTSININVNNLNAQRVDAGNFRVTTLKISAKGISDLNQEIGYLE